MCAAALFVCEGAGAQKVKEDPASWLRRENAEYVDGPTPNDGTQRAQRAARIVNRSLNPIGSPRIPVILVQFPDLALTKGTKEAYERFYNTDNVSVAQYFRDQSDKQFDPQFTIIGPVTLPKSYTYYGKDSGSMRDVNINEFYKDALTAALEEVEDWSIFDSDGDGVVDMLLYMYAGPAQNADGTKENIWPKESSTQRTIGDVTVGCFAVASELYNGALDGIGVICHEVSHAFALPDFYDKEYDDYGMDYWDLMASGDFNKDGYCPCGFTSYEKDYVGWKSLEVLDTDKDHGYFTLTPMSEGGTGYKLVSSTGDENKYYILENRQNTGWDEWIGMSTNKYGKHHGMLVLQVDYDETAWLNNLVNSTTQRMTVLPACGKLVSKYDVDDNGVTVSDYMENAAAIPFPGTQHVTEIEALDIHEITEKEDGTITFRLGAPVCEAPTVKLSEGKLKFECETPESEIHYTVEDVSMESATFDGDSFTLPNRTLRVTAYATAEGHYQSATATYTFVLQNEDVNGDGEVTVADITKVADAILNQE